MEDKQGQRAKVLPEELVEKIISMLPFPSLFKARGLSKSWLSRFSPISSQGDEVKKRLATSFQKQVRERSENWGSFFPVRFDKDFVSVRAYHQTSQKWVKFPSLSFLPEVFFKSHPDCFGMEGPLLFKVDWGTQILYVANIFTRSCKEVALPADLSISVFSPALVRDPLSDTYEAIFLHGANVFTLGSALIYESKADKWREVLIKGGQYLEGYGVYLNGNLYIAGPSDSLHSLQVFNVEEGTWEEIQLSFNGEIDVYMCYVVASNAQLLMIVIECDYWRTVHVLKIDLVSRELLEVGKGPPAALHGSSRFRVDASSAPASVGAHIFFPVNSRPDNQMVAYDVQTNEWSYVDFSLTLNEAFNPAMDSDWFGYSLQPGLNPFAEV